MSSEGEIRKHRDSNERAIVTDFNLHIVKGVFIFDYQHKLIMNEFNNHFKEQAVKDKSISQVFSNHSTYEEAWPAVVQLIMQFDNDIYLTGTAFFVAPNILVTAKHYLRPLNSTAYIGLTIVFDDEPGIPKLPEKKERQYKVKEIPLTVDTNIIDKDPKIDLPRDFSCDFAFLECNNYTSSVFLVPNISVKQGDTIATMGFNYKPNKEVLSIFFDDISKVNPLTILHLMANFNEAFTDFRRMHASPGSILTSTLANTVAHDCSTLNGSSGGCVIGADKKGTFSFIHIGEGIQYADAKQTIMRPKEERNYNVMLSVAHPEFKKSYRAIVLPKIDISKLTSNQQLSLKEYLQ